MFVNILPVEYLIIFIFLGKCLVLCKMTLIKLE